MTVLMFVDSSDSILTYQRLLVESYFCQLIPQQTYRQIVECGWFHKENH